MNVLGISGIEDALSFKRQEWPHLEERELRIVQGLDAAAALIVDGVILAAVAEERLDRIKHSGRFPINAIRYCLSNAGISIGDVDEVAHSFHYEPYSEVFKLSPYSRRVYDSALSKDVFMKRLRCHFPVDELPDERVVSVRHHLAHASSAYFCSGWDECLVLIADATGEVEGLSVWHARDGRISLLKSISSDSSIGWLYSIVTLHLGFDFNSDEYKIMGLAPYGDPERFQSFFSEAVELTPEGGLRIPMLRLSRNPIDRETFKAVRAHLESNLLKHRAPDEEITNDHRDVAASLQRTLENAIFHVCRHYRVKTGLTKLAMAGGVALNCSANGKLLRSNLFDEVFVQPAAGDDGAALGAALWRAALGGDNVSHRMPPPYLGPGYTESLLHTAIEAYRSQVTLHRFSSPADTCREAAEWIGGRAVIGWYRGRAEFGPRALGNRSILADPGCPNMRDRINALVKKREAFRPFAPAVTAEEASRWFDIPAGADLSTMLFVVPVREEYRSKLPAVTHVDGSARLQIVTSESNNIFHRLLKEVGRCTGREMVLNTSFNIKAQPIVTTPQEAISTFLATDLDALFMDDFLVLKR
jgi:carbamoyltransferase